MRNYETSTLRSPLDGFTADEKRHHLSVWCILALRLMVVLALCQSGLDAYIGQYDRTRNHSSNPHAWMRDVPGYLTERYPGRPPHSPENASGSVD